MSVLDRLPFTLEDGLTRGQAMDRLALLEREHVRGVMRALAV
jgi:hypothetical protein